MGTANQKENEWKTIFQFALIHTLGLALLLNVFSTVIMFSLGAGDQVSPIYKNALPVTFLLAVAYALFVGRKIQNRINFLQS
tara:strand:+ start:376 stop:621 length:246 start_codon:yes stop_codon:yes gene_type:complete